MKDVSTFSIDSPGKVCRDDQASLRVIRLRRDGSESEPFPEASRRRVGEPNYLAQEISLASMTIRYLV
jgi:hypothetical protein